MSAGWVSASLSEKIPEQAIRTGQDHLALFLERESKGLNVEWESSLRNGWLNVRAKGEDVEAFLNILRKGFDSCPIELTKLEKWDTVRGWITGSGKVGFGVYVDVGVFEPIGRDALYPLYRMRAQLADGAPKPCREILDLNGLVDDFPIRVRITGIENEKISVELSDESREFFEQWHRLPFDRVVSIGATQAEVERAIKSAGLWFDVIRIEPLSLFSQCLVCKIGTDAPGVIAKLGNRLPGVKLAPVRAVNPLSSARKQTERQQ